MAARCAKGEKLEAISNMAKAARDGAETCLAKEIMRRMRKNSAHEAVAAVPSK